MPSVIVTGSSGRGPEGFVLDPDAIVGAPVDLGTTTGLLRLQSLTLPPARKLPTWALNGDADGQQLVRTPFYANRENCQMTVRVRAGSGDAAMGAIGQLSAKLQEADKIDGGLPVLWTPAGATVGYRLYMLLAEVTDIPITVDDGWFAHKPSFTVQFICKPFLYKAETSVAAVTSSAPVVTIDVPDVGGDVDAEARLVLTDASSQTRRFVEWGLEQLHYTPSSPTPVVIDSASMLTGGFAGTPIARSGAYGGTTIGASLFEWTTAVCGTGPQPHVGTFRVKGRIYPASTDEYWRLTWQQGDAPHDSNDYAKPVHQGGFSEVDLGLITVEPVSEGTQSWSGRIEAYTTTAGGEIGEIDMLELFPAGEGYGRIANAYSYQGGVVVGYDHFTGTTAGTALNGRVAPSGGTWATSGATGDFVFADGPTFGAESVYRDETTDTDYRYAILGSTSHTDTEVGVNLTLQAGVETIDSLLIARWQDSSNYLRLRLLTDQTILLVPSAQLWLETVIGGTVSVVGISLPLTTSSIVGCTLRLIAYASGRAIGWLLDGNGNTLLQTDGRANAIATGTLASGKVGFADFHHGSFVLLDRYYDGFFVSLPADEQVAINAGRSLEIRSDANLRQSLDGSTYGAVTGRGGRLFIPPAGAANRTSRIAVKATRSDLTSMADTSVDDADSLTAHLYYTPRFLTVPR